MDWYEGGDEQITVSQGRSPQTPGSKKVWLSLTGVSYAACDRKGRSDAGKWGAGCLQNGHNVRNCMPRTVAALV